MLRAKLASVAERARLRLDKMIQEDSAANPHNPSARPPVVQTPDSRRAVVAGGGPSGGSVGVGTARSFAETGRRDKNQGRTKRKRAPKDKRSSTSPVLSAAVRKPGGKKRRNALLSRLLD